MTVGGEDSSAIEKNDGCVRIRANEEVARKLQGSN